MNWHNRLSLLIIGLMICMVTPAVATEDCDPCEEPEDPTLVYQGADPCRPKAAGAAISGEDCKECDGQGNVRNKPDGPIAGNPCQKCVNGVLVNEPEGTAIPGEDCKECDGNGGERNKPAGTAIPGEDCRECDGNGGDQNKQDGPISGNPCQKCVNGVLVNEPTGTAISGEDCKECDGQGGERNKPAGTVMPGEDCRECDGQGGERNKLAGTAIPGVACKECDGRGGERNKPDGPIAGNPCQKCVNGVVVNEPAGTAIPGEDCKECDGNGGMQNKRTSASLTPLDLKAEYCKCDSSIIHLQIDNDMCCTNGKFIPGGTIIERNLSLSTCGSVTEHLTYECLSVDLSYVVLKKVPTKPADPSVPDKENGFGSKEDVASMAPCSPDAGVIEPEHYHYCAPGVRIAWSWEKSLQYVEKECKSWDANLSGNINISASADWQVTPYTYIWKDHFNVGSLCLVPYVPGAIHGVSEDSCKDFINSINNIILASGWQVFATQSVPTGKCCEIYTVCFWKKQANIKAKMTVTFFTQHEYRDPGGTYNNTVYFPSTTAEDESGWRDTNEWAGDIGSPGYECN